MVEFDLAHRSGDSVGDSYAVKHPSHTRVVFQNTGTLPDDPSLSKQQIMERWLKQDQVGIAMFAETNRHWPSLPEGWAWRDRIKPVTKEGYFAVSSHNVDQDRKLATSSLQPGGTALALLGSVSHAVRDSGTDSTGLGCWSFVRL